MILSTERGIEHPDRITVTDVERHARTVSNAVTPKTDGFDERAAVIADVEQVLSPIAHVGNALDLAKEDILKKVDRIAMKAAKKGDAQSEKEVAEMRKVASLILVTVDEAQKYMKRLKETK